jgi:hypothetical protein
MIWVLPIVLLGLVTAWGFSKVYRMGKRAAFGQVACPHIACGTLSEKHIYVGKIPTQNAISFVCCNCKRPFAITAEVIGTTKESIDAKHDNGREAPPP